MSQPLVLASSSPYRRDLLARLGLAFQVDRPDVDERALPGESPADTAARLAEVKARHVATRHPGALVIGCDQVAELDGEPLGKPGGFDAAARQLARMSGRAVVFHSALCLFNALTGRATTRVIPYEVQFRPLEPDLIRRYLEREEPYDCAGSAKAEGLGIALIARMGGDDPNALIGLPLIALVDLLVAEGVRVV